MAVFKYGIYEVAVYGSIVPLILSVMTEFFIPAVIKVQTVDSANPDPPAAVFEKVYDPVITQTVAVTWIMSEMFKPVLCTIKPVQTVRCSYPKRSFFVFNNILH